MRKFLAIMFIVGACVGVAPAASASSAPVIYYDQHKVGSRWAVDHAVASWEKSGRVNFVRVTSCQGVSRCFDFRSSYQPLADWMGRTYVHPTTKRLTVEVNRAFRGYPWNYRAQTTTHEVGHVLQVPHTRVGVMAAYCDGTTVPTSYELSLVGMENFK